MKKSTIIIIMLSSILTACSRRDTKLAEEIPGTWTHSAHAMAMTPDGSFTESFRSKTGTNTFAGTWQIKDGILIFTTTNDPAGASVQRYKISHLDAHQLVYEMNGQTITLSR